MTKKKKANKNEKPRNLTAHQRAMARPEVQEIFKSLRACWKDLSPQQRCEKLSVLSGFKCSGHGIAKELGESESNIRRYIPKTNPLKEGSDFATMVKSTLAKEPQKQSTKRAREDVRRIPSKIPAKKKAEPIMKETYPMQDQARTLTAQQTKGIISPSSAAAKEPQVASGVISGREDERTVEERIQRLALMHEQIKPRRVFNAHSMRRQG